MSKTEREQAEKPVLSPNEKLLKALKRSYVYHKSGKLLYKVKGKWYSAGHSTSNGYHSIVFEGINKTRGHWIWFYHYGTFPKRLYRINGNKKDDRLENLSPKKKGIPLIVNPIAAKPRPWACSSIRPGFMFKEENVQVALQICKICTTRKECLDRIEGISPGYVYGVWGGKAFKLI